MHNLLYIFDVFVLLLDKSTKFNMIRGEDKWIGRRVKKKFDGHGIFFCRVTDVDEDTKNNGHRILMETASG